MKAFIAASLTFLTVTSQAFAFCSEKAADAKAIGYLTSAAKQAGVTISEAKYAKFLSNGDTVFNYKIIYNLVSKTGNTLKFVSIDIDADAEDCRILDINATDAREFKL